MKILYAASTSRHIRDFHMPVLNGLLAEGFTVTAACRGADKLSGGFRTLEVPFAKSFISLKNAAAFVMLAGHIRKERYDIISTHTALAGFVTRMALRFAGKKNAYCIHTAHGYLFGKGTALSGKLTYIFEKMCAGVTDLILTMNREDTVGAGKLVRRGGDISETCGMGVDDTRFAPATAAEKALLRKTLGLPDGFLMICAAEFSHRKNQQSLIRAMPLIDSRAVLLLAGDGKCEKALRRLVRRLNLTGRVVFLGYLDDTSPYIKASDMALSASLSEGLPLSVIEALCCRVPVAASRVKGHIDLMGFDSKMLFHPHRPKEIADCCNALINGEPPLFPAENDAICNKTEAAQKIIEYYIKMA